MKNVIKLILFIFCVGMILHDVYMLTIYSFISGKLATLTWFGGVTFILNIIIAVCIYDDLQTKKYSYTPTKAIKNTYNHKYN